jgi:ankyrin repeat protein
LVSTPSQARLIAPASDPVHREFCRAAKEGQSIVRLKYLLDRGANIDSRDMFSSTALYHAAFKGDHDTVDFLLKNGADVNSQDDIVGTPICVAAIKAHERVIEVLLEHNANVTESYGKALGSAMHCACFGGSLSIFKSILAKGGSLTNMSTVSVYAMLELSKERWPPAKIMQSLASGKNCSPGQCFVECSPILLAAERCHFDILRLFWPPCDGLSNVAPADSTVIVSRHSPNDVCWKFSKVQVASQFQTSQSSANESYNLAQHASGLSYTSSKASSSSAWSFMGFSRPPPDQGTSTLLMRAAGSLNLRLINFLLESGASVDRDGLYGKKCLHYAAAPFKHANFGNFGVCVKRLMELASDLTVYDSLSTESESACKAPLLLAMDKEHAALDPHVQHTWGPNIHDGCVAAIIDNMTSVSRRSAVSHDAIFRALSQGVVNLDTFERLCANDAALCGKDRETETHTPVVSKRAWPCYHRHSVLHEALENRVTAPIISILLQNKCDPNGLDDDHCTPLLAALKKGADISVLSVLVDHGADPDLPAGGFNLTPRAFAERAGGVYNLGMLFNRTVDQPPPAPTGHKQRALDAIPNVSSRRWFQGRPAFDFMNSKKAR